MRRVGSALALLGLVGVLTSCAITPPVLGGPSPTDGPVDGAWSDEDVAALLILDDPDSENVVLTLADYRDDALAETPDVDPAECRDILAPLLPAAGDETADGSVVVSPPLFREAPGADLLVTQRGRRFGSAAEATAFLEELSAARGDCRVVEGSDGSRTELELVPGDLEVSATGFARTTTAADGSVSPSFEWVLVHDNVALSLGAELLDDDDAGILRDLAEEYAETLSR